MTLTPEQLEAELHHRATTSDLHREMAIQTRWLMGVLIAIQIPTWIALLQIWGFLATVAAKLPK